MVFMLQHLSRRMISSYSTLNGGVRRPSDSDTLSQPSCIPSLSLRLLPEPRLSQQGQTDTHLATTQTRLRKPIAIPAAHSGYEADFLRAYPPILASYGISKSQFLGFLDKLNQVKLGVPPLRVLDEMAGEIGSAPVSKAQMVSLGVETAAKIGHYATGETRAEILIHKMNKEVFRPRGLKMEIAKLEALANMAGMNHLLIDELKLNRHAQLLDPISDIVHAPDVTTRQRRMQLLDQWIESLDFTPAQKKRSSSPLKRLEDKASTKIQANYEKRMKRKRLKAATAYQQQVNTARKTLEKRLSELQTEEDKAYLRYASEPTKLERERSSIDRERSHAYEEFCEDMQDAEVDRKSDDEEDEEMKDILFLTIRNLDSDSLSSRDPFLDQR